MQLSCAQVRMLWCPASVSQTLRPGAQRPLTMVRLRLAHANSSASHPHLLCPALPGACRRARAGALSCRRRSPLCAANGDGDRTLKRTAPWNISWDIRERETTWSEENKARLVAVVASQRLCMGWEDMEAALDSLMLLVPDLASKFTSLRVDVLVALIRDLDAIPARLIALRSAFPTADVSAMAAAQPQLLLQTAEALESSALALRDRFEDAATHPEQVDRLVTQQPLVLVPEALNLALDEISRLMPQQNPAEALLHDPSWLLRVQRGQHWLGQNPDSDQGELI